MSDAKGLQNAKKQGKYGHGVKKVFEKFGGYKKKQYLCTAFEKRDASFNPQCTGV